MSGNETAETPTTKKRVRTGCLTCRRRRRKCDEAKPSCANCQNKRFRCRYGVNLTFLPDNASILNPEDIRSFPSPAPYPEIKFVTSFEDGSSEKGELNEGSTSRNDQDDSSATPEPGLDPQGIFPGNRNSPDEEYELALISPEPYSYSTGQLNFSATNASNSGSELSPKNPSSDDTAQENEANEVYGGDESNARYVLNHNHGYATLGMDTVNLSPLPSNCQENVASNEVADYSTRGTHTSSIGEKELQLLKYYRYEVAPWVSVLWTRIAISNEMLANIKSAGHMRFTSTIRSGLAHRRKNASTIK